MAAITKAPEVRVNVLDVRKLRFKRLATEEMAQDAMRWFLEQSPAARASTIMRAYAVRHLFTESSLTK